MPGHSERTVGGEFVRADSDFRRWVRADPAADFPAEAGRYHFYVSHACPWSHRALILLRLKGLDDAIDQSVVHPVRDERGWAFGTGEYRDAVNGFAFLSEAYEATAPGYEGRVSVPVLWDTHEQVIVSNESADIMQMLNGEFDQWGDPSVDFYPAPLREEIDAINAWMYPGLNNGVYRAGFARTQDAYDAAFAGVFAALDRAEELLARGRYLTGDRITLADWRLWVTLVRFDRVYHTHFRCNGRRVADYPNLLGFTRELYQWPGVTDTIFWDDILVHYYTTHDELNPKHIIPGGPLDHDLMASHGRS